MLRSWALAVQGGNQRWIPQEIGKRRKAGTHRGFPYMIGHRPSTAGIHPFDIAQDGFPDKIGRGPLTL